ncbi:MAG TPA: hypothetical protein VFQ23_12665, partial [Anaerolineales bacterium]|nr:hypothetical protein [Anaerolineales bacterium]
QTSIPTNTVQPTLASIATETPASSTSMGACPTETADLKLFMNADDGYCLLYPTVHTAIPPYMIVINPTGLAGDMPGDAFEEATQRAIQEERGFRPRDMPGDAWVYINVEAASGRTATQVADGQIAEAGAGWNITRSEILIDGKQAIVVDGLPRPVPLRAVFIVANDRLYTLLFMRMSSNSEVFAQLEELYAVVIDTFHFLPPTP